MGGLEVHCVITNTIDNIQGAITNILDENVVQPLLVSTSAIQLASETVRCILKIDDVVCTFGRGRGGVILISVSTVVIFQINAMR